MKPLGLHRRFIKSQTMCYFDEAFTYQMSRRFLMPINCECFDDKSVLADVYVLIGFNFRQQIAIFIGLQSNNFYMK
jgi:hypothetical protein